MTSLPPPRFPTVRCGRLAALAAGVPALSVAAAEAAAPGVSVGTMLQTFAMLALLLALFVGAAWLTRRLNGGRGLIGGQGPLRIVGALALGPRERILLVEVEDTWLVIGIAPGQMRTLHTLPKGNLPPPATVGDGQFGQWLKHFRNPPHDAKD